MKKVLSILLAVMMLLSVGAITASASDNYSISAEEGTPFDSVEGEAVGYIGDTDNSLDVTIKDVTVIQKHIAGLLTLEGASEILADTDLSGDITIKDATIIQKWIAGLEISAPVFHLLYEEQSALSIVGTWETTMDAAEGFNMAIESYEDPLLTKHVQIDSFMLKMIYTFDENGVYTAVCDKEFLNENIPELKKELEGDIGKYMEAVAKEKGLNMTAEQLLTIMGYDSMSEFIDEMFPQEMIDALAAPASGTYRVDENKLYMVLDGEEATDYYETIIITEDTITVTGNSLGESEEMYPITFNRIK